MRAGARKRALAAVERARIAVRRAPQRLVSLDEAASAAALSPIRLHQVFKEVQGETFGAFVRRVRLEYACGLMRARPEWTCTRIAHEAGYSESSDFTRTFARAFGLPPSRWDRVTPLNSQHNPDKNRQDCVDAGISMSVFGSAPGDTSWPVTIETLPARRVAVLMVREAHLGDNLHRGFDALERWLDERGQMREERTLLGLSYDSDYETPPEHYRYELACEVDEDVDAAGEVVVRTLPATQAAVLTCRGGPEVFVPAWDYLGRVFLPAGSWAPGPGPAIERYYNDPRPHGMAYWDMDCIQPVQRNGEGLSND